MTIHIYYMQLPSGRWLCSYEQDFTQALVSGYGLTPYEAKRNLFAALASYL